MTHCRKCKYRTELDAKIALWQTTLKRNEEKRREIRVYYHRNCQAWHLTSEHEKDTP